MHLTASSWQLVLSLVCYTISTVLSCQVHLCYNEYTHLASGYTKLQQRASFVRSISTRDSLVREYCATLQAYSVCMKGLSRSCRGKLDYHAVIAHVNKWIDDYNCTGNAKSRSPGKSSFNLALRQQQADKNNDYPWTGSSSITHASSSSSSSPSSSLSSSQPKTRRKSKKCRKHASHVKQRNLPESDASTYSSASHVASFTSVISFILLQFIIQCST